MYIKIMDTAAGYIDDDGLSTLLSAIRTVLFVSARSGPTPGRYLRCGREWWCVGRYETGDGGAHGGRARRMSTVAGRGDGGQR